MRILAPGAAAITLVLAGAACSDSLAPENIAGPYTVSVWELTSVATPAKNEEWIAGGVKISFVIGADGSFSITATWDETATVDASGGLLWQFSGGTFSGTIAIDGSTVTISLPRDPDNADFTLVPCSGPISRSGNTLTWTLPDCLRRDFGDGTEEPVILRVVATRSS
jgi:hypothetical protein